MCASACSSPYILLFFLSNTTDSFFYRRSILYIQPIPGMASLATNVLDISSLEEWEDALSKAQSTLVVTFFWAEFHEPSKRGGQMDMVFTALAGKYASKVNFLKVDAEKVPEVTGKYPVASVPTFVFIRNGATLGKVEGANPPELMKRVQLLSSQSNQPVVKKAASEEEKKKA